jgi:hypothetical protein
MFAGMLELDLPHLPKWAIPLAASLAASLVFFIGMFLVRRSRRSTAEADVGAFLQGSLVDRRQWPRRKGNRLPVLVRGAGTEPIEAWVLDRSEGGIGLLVDDPIAVGTALSIRPAGASAAVPWLAVEVRVCRSIVGGVALGCHFVEPPPLHILLLFG